MDRRFTPAISVVVACYNHAVYLSEALNSIYIQSFNNWECLIVDDGSTDNTKEVAEKWLKIDNRFRYIYQNNKGVSSARNLGISKARGKYILPLATAKQIRKIAQTSNKDYRWGPFDEHLVEGTEYFQQRDYLSAFQTLAKGICYIMDEFRSK